MPIQTQLQQQIFQVLRNNFPELDISLNQILITTSKFENVDFSSNICFQISSKLKANPKEMVEKLSQVLNIDNKLVEVTNLNGYLNFKLKNEVYFHLLTSSLPRVEHLTSLKNQKPKGHIMIEFGQPNTHKAFHIGHLKSAITGLSLSNLIENQGYEVIRANYFGDVGLQVAKCIFGANVFLSNIEYLKTIDSTGQISSLELLDKGKSQDEIDENTLSFETSLPNLDELQISEIPNDIEDKVKNCVELIEKMPNDAKAKLVDKFYSFGSKVYKEVPKFTEFIRKINRQVYDQSSEAVNYLYKITRDWSIEHQNEAFESLGIHYDRQYPESEVWKLGEKTVKENIGRIFIVDQKGGGSVILNKDLLTEQEKKQVKTFVYITSDGLPTYSAKDVGLIQLKTKEYPNLDKIIITTSIEQADYFKNLFKALSLLGLNPDGKKMQHVAFGWLLRNNKKQSSRMGESIKGLDVINEIVSNVKEKMKFEDDDVAEKLALASLKFLILSHEIHTDINYDPDEFVSLTGFSGIYIMYAYVRSLGIIRNNDERLKVQNVNINDLNYKFSNSEKELILKLVEFENISKLAAEKLEPHLICHYLYEVANLFNIFYSENQVLVEDEKLKNIRLQIVRLTNYILKKGMWLVGIETVEKM